MVINSRSVGTMKKNSYERIIFLIYIAGFLAMSITMALYQPHLDIKTGLLLSPPDEYNRMLIPYFICKYGYLPTGLEEAVRIHGYGFSYGLYNTLPYIIQGYAMRFVSLFNSSDIAMLYTGRLVNVAFGTIMCIVVYLLSKRLFEDSCYRWLFCFGIMYLPQSLFLHTYINTDSMCMLSTAMMLYGLVWGYQEGFQIKNSIWIALGISICSLSYYNAYGYILACFLLFVIYYIHVEQKKWSFDLTAFRYGIFITVLVLICAGWWFVRAYFVLDGDILGFRMKQQLQDMYGFSTFQATYQARGVGILQMLVENNFARSFISSFIAAYGGMSITGNYWTYGSYGLLFLVGFLGVIKSVILEAGWSKMSVKERIFHLMMLFTILCPFIILISFSYTMDYQHQGRYCMPSLVPLMYYTIFGLSSMLNGPKVKPSWRRVLIALAFFITIGSAYYMVFIKALPVYKSFDIMLDVPWM